MKKILFAAAIVSLLAPSFAFAASATPAPGAQVTGTRTNNNPQPLGQLSNNVTLTVNYSSSSYAVATKHLNGTKIYGTSSGDTKIFFKDGTAGTALLNTDLGTASDSGAFTSGWSSL